MLGGVVWVGNETRVCEERIAGIWGCIGGDAIEGGVGMPVFA